MARQQQFGGARQFGHAVFVHQNQLVIVAAKSGRPNVADQQGDTFAGAFELGVGHQVLTFGGKTHAIKRPRLRPLRLGSRKKNVGVFDKVQVGHFATAVFFDFLLTGGGGPPIRHGRRGDQGTGPRQGLQGGGHHVLRRHHIDPLHPMGGGQLHRPGNQHHLGTRFLRGPGNGKTHLARGVVGDAAHRVNRLKGGACRDQHLLPGQAFGLKVGNHLGHQIGGLQHAPVTGFTTGLIPGAHAQHNGPIGRHLVQVALGRRVGPHFPVHGRGQQQGRALTRSGQAQQAEQFIGPTLGQFGDEVGTARGDQQRIGLPAELDVGHVVVHAGVPLRTEHGPPRQGLHRHRRDELGRRLRHHHLHRGAFALQIAAKLGGFVASHPPGESQQNVFAL